MFKFLGAGVYLLYTLNLEDDKMIGKKYTDEVIYERAAAKGFSITEINRENDIPFVHMKCKKGHKRTVNANQLQSSTCQICEGKRYDLSKAIKYLKSIGYKFKGTPTLSEDRYGNKVVKSVTRFVAICPEGHEYRNNLTGFGLGERCTLCSGTAANAGYSRSEEIIAKILSYNDVTYIRQKDMVVDGERVYLDFFIPDFNLILEYDGSHHTYRRSNGTKEDLAEVQRKDKLRDKYARDNGINIVRIFHTIEGKALVYALEELIPELNIDVDDVYYNWIVARVFSESADRFGWLTYEEMQENALAYLNNSLSDASSITGVSQTVIARHFRRIYGMNKVDYLKKFRGGEVG